MRARRHKGLRLITQQQPHPHIGGILFNFLHQAFNEDGVGPRELVRNRQDAVGLVNFSLHFICVA